MNFYNTDYLEHHGILGQKWGVRRYQNRDGSLTPEGKRRIYAQGASDGYETRKNRFKRSVEGAKYNKDLINNQEKIINAIVKGDEKKKAKYRLAEKILEKNRDIMYKDLSTNEIKLGQDYLALRKAILIGSIVAGPIGSGVAGATSMRKSGYRKTQDKVNKEEAIRRAEYNNKKAAEQKWWDEYQKKRNSFKTDEEKDRWQARVERTGKL